MTVQALYSSLSCSLGPSSVNPCDFRIDAGQNAVKRLLALPTVGALAGEFRNCADHERPRNLAISAWQGDQLLGVALGTSDFEALTCITEMTVEREHRRRGIGRELMRRMQDVAPCARVLLLATPLMEPYDPARRTAVTAFVGECCDSLHDRGTDEPAWLQLIDAILAAEYANKLSVGKLARRVGLHRVHVSRTFLRLRHESIIQALRRRRVDAACRHLMRGEVVLAGLALDVGFSDQAQFSRAFKGVTGTTPGVFRALFRRRRAMERPAVAEEWLDSHCWPRAVGALASRANAPGF